MNRIVFQSHVHFESLAKLFFDLAEERYPSSDKVKQLVLRLVNPLTEDPLEKIYMQIAVVNGMRDMIREVSPGQIYRSLQHRDDLYLAIIEASEDLEDELEELEEKLGGEEEDV